MEYTAKVSSVRITPRKMGVLVDEVRGKNINAALNYLELSRKRRAAFVLKTLLKSAVANADNKSKGAVDVDNLVISEILVGKAMTMKRFRPRAKGSAFPIQKRTSHISVKLVER